MRANTAIRKIFKSLKLFMKVVAIRPYEKQDGFVYYVVSFLWWFHFFNQSIVLIPTVRTFIMTIENIATALYCMIEMLAMLEVLLILIIFKVQKKRLKFLLDVTERFLESSEFKDSEKIDFFYVKFFTLFMILYNVLMATYIYAVTSLSSEGRIMLTAQYPFSIDSMYLKILLYLNQVIGNLHIATVVIADTFVFMVLYACKVRLENLKDRFGMDFDDLKYRWNIQEHSNILFTIKEANKIVGIVVMKSISCFVCYCVCAGLQMSKGLTIHNIVQVLILITVYVRISISCECSQEMLTISDEIQDTIFHTSWLTRSREIMSTKIQIIHRSQHLPRIHINGFMSSLDRRFLYSILNVTYSYFMGVRAVLQEHK